MSNKLQSLRPDPYKPSVTRKHNGWWAKVKAGEGQYVCELFPTWRDAYDAAVRMVGS